MILDILNLALPRLMDPRGLGEAQNAHFSLYVKQILLMTLCVATAGILK